MSIERSSDANSRPTRRGSRVERLRSGSDLHLASLLAVTVAGSMLAVGAVHVPSVLAIAGVAVLVAMQTVRLRLAATNIDKLPVPFLVLMSLGTYTLLQAVPMPMTWLQAVAPATADVWQRSLLPFGEQGPRWATLSLDPGASLVEGVKWLSYAAVFLGAATLSLVQGASAGLGIVLGSALLAALVTVGHGLLGATRVFGIYQPRFGAAAWHVGPLLNPNNLAGYLNLGVFCGLGLMLTPNALPSWAYGIGIATVVGVSITTASRAGFCALLLGLAVVAALLFRSRAQRPKSGAPPISTVAWLMGATLIGGTALAVLGSTGQTWNELYQTNVEKVQMLVWAKPMISDHPWFGIGRGAFESVFPAYRSSGGNVVFTHAENFPGQWLAEWGIPVTVGTAGAFVWAFRRHGPSRTKDMLTACAWTGVGVLLLQNLFDLGLEVASIGLALAVVLGSLWGDRDRATVHVGRKIYSSARRGWQWGVAAAAIAVISWAGVRGWHDLVDDREHAHELVDEAHSPVERTRLLSFVHDAMRRHPAEPYFPLVGAIASHQAKENPLPWIERSLERAVLNPRAHLFLADVLGSTRRFSQALLELRIAAQQEPDLNRYVATAALRWTRDLGQLMGAVPSGTPGTLVLEQMANQLSENDDELRTALLTESLARAPNSAESHLALADTLLREMQRPGSTACASERRQWCEAEITRHTNVVEAALPNVSSPARLRAALLVTQGEPERAEVLLRDRCRSVPDIVECTRAWVQVAARIKNPSRMQVAARELIATACSGASECADALTWIGDLMSERREWGGALSYYARAVQEHPTEARWLRVADASAQVGADAEEAAALEKVAQMRGHVDSDLQSRIDRSRTKSILR